MLKISVDERAQHLLKILVEHYIRDGQPVASGRLAREGTVGWSAATIRNILAELEEHGYLTSPHTSSGRVPTEQAYRLFVDSLLAIRPIEGDPLVCMEQTLYTAKNEKEILARALNMLADLTQLTGIVTLPRREQQILRYIEFLPLHGNRVLVILVINEKEVQNRIIYLDKPYTTRELQQAAQYLCKHFIGKELSVIRSEILKILHGTRININELMQNALIVAEKALNETSHEEDYMIAGQEHLFELAEETSIDHLRELFDTFTQKRDILHLLDQCLGAEGLQIFIGREAKHPVLDECSMVTTTYQEKGRIVGVLGVIGPTRMDYEQAIRIVDMTAKLLSTALNHGEESPS